MTDRARWFAAGVATVLLAQTIDRWLRRQARGMRLRPGQM